MRKLAFSILITAALFHLPTFVFAQEDDEEAAEGGEDIDDLMASDPERPEPAEEEAGDQEAPAEGAEGEAGMFDDERPPGDEPSAEAEPREEDVEAEDGATADKPLSVALLAGYGLSLESGANPWGVGFGIRGGYNIGGFYIGPRFMYYVGESATTIRFDSFGRMRTEDITANLWDLGVEAGYDIPASATLSIRPEFAVGLASVSAVQSQTVAYVSPGLAALLDVSDAFFLGLDVRYQFVATELGASGLGFFATLGMRF